MIRKVVCPMCGEHLEVLTLQDDTRHRYPPHTNVVAEKCEMSRELVEVAAKDGS